MQDLIAKAETLLEALPYMQKFRGETFVVKYGGSFMDSPDANVRNGVARDMVFLEAVEINPIVVHGGGKAITRAMDEDVLAGLERVIAAAKTTGCVAAALDSRFAAHVLFTLVAGLFKRLALEPAFDPRAEGAMAIGVLRALFAGALAPAEGI